MKVPRLIIFDLDGTFYDINDVIAQVYDCQVAFFSAVRRIGEKETMDVFAKHGIFPCVNAGSKSCTEYFEQEGISRDDWAAYRESHFDVSKIDVSKAVNPEVIGRFASACSIYLLSSNTYNTIRKVLDRLGIDVGLFKGVVSSDRFVSPNKFNKHEAMAALMEGAVVKPGEALSVGDRYNTDILPMLELGGDGVLVRSSQALGVLCEGMFSGKIATCEEYVCFGQDSVSQCGEVARRGLGLK